MMLVTGSHQNGIERFSPPQPPEVADICRVPKGGIMIMRPLFQHASSRSTTGKRRRVIHLEFSNARLPEELNWAEKQKNP
jgi:ectoine hydroxylase-related dioxygenase (phytanoyl-CoA dioxygenase family)